MKCRIVMTKFKIPMLRVKCINEYYLLYFYLYSTNIIFSKNRPKLYTNITIYHSITHITNSIPFHIEISSF